MAFIYIREEDAIRLHDFAIDMSGGRLGILNIGLLESVLTLIQNDDYYPSFEEKMTHLFYAINKNHAFNDGNKRASILISAYFLQLNGFFWKVDSFIRIFENVAVNVANNIIDKPLLHEMIIDFIHIDTFTEDLKLKIIHALSNDS